MADHMFIDVFVVFHFQLLQIGYAVVDELVDALLGLNESIRGVNFIFELGIYEILVSG
jgi:hypothetical protein